MPIDSLVNSDTIQQMQALHPEVSVVLKSNIDVARRFDADYFRPEFLETAFRLDAITNATLGSMSHTIYRYPTFSNLEYHQRGHLVIKGEDLGALKFVESKSNDYIDSETHDRFPITKLQEADLVFTVRGYVGKVGIITPDLQDSNISANLIRISLDRSKINSFFTWIFLNSRFGLSQIRRAKMITAQETIVSTDIKKFRVPIFSDEFQLGIERAVKTAHAHQGRAKTLYGEADKLLLSELGLLDYKPAEALTYEASSREVAEAGRFDADYFQPKYKQVEQAIKDYAGGSAPIKDEFRHNQSNYAIDGEKNYKYVEIGSVDVGSGEINPSDITGSELPANAKRVLYKDDVIISKVRTYRGAIGIVEEDGHVGSGAFTVLAENGRINKETLFVFLRSKPMLMWSLKPNTGTSYPVIVDNDILNLRIPLFSPTVQSDIAAKVAESARLRVESKRLLEVAKRAVELAIEEGEAAAAAYLTEAAKAAA